MARAVFMAFDHCLTVGRPREALGRSRSAVHVRVAAGPVVESGDTALRGSAPATHRRRATC
jgi:hypothetical protein